MTANRRGILLEPDRSLLDRNLLFNDPSDGMDDILIKQRPDSSNLPWTTIKPTPGFCVKLRKNTPEREKVFINICKTDQIPAPEDKSESELMEILNSDEPSTYRVPMSIGEERADYDKSGKPCAVFDIVVNSKFYKKVESSQLYRRFVITATFEALEDKYGLELEKEEFAVLKGRACKGGMTEHRIQVRSKPLVEMLPSNKMIKSNDWELDYKSGADGSKKPLITEIESSHTIASKNQNTSDKHPQPPYILRWKDTSGGSNEKIILAEFLLKNVLYAKEIELDVGEDRILLHTKDDTYLLDIFLPLLIDQEKTKAKFLIENKILMLEMPVVH